MPITRSVVNSVDEEYPSLTAACQSFYLKSASSILVAIQGTECGLYRTAGGLQWAYKDNQPEEWPSEPVKPVKPVKPERTLCPRVEQPGKPPQVPMYPHVYNEEMWCSVPGLPGYEVSSGCRVRDTQTGDNLRDLYYGDVSMVKIDGRLYNVVDLMLLAFIGPKPRGYIIQQRIGVGEKLHNVYYEPRKPRNSLTKGEE